MVTGGDLESQGGVFFCHHSLGKNVLWESALHSPQTLLL